MKARQPHGPGSLPVREIPDVRIGHRAFELIVSPLLIQETSLGSVRRGLLDSSVLHLSPTLGLGGPSVPESLFVAVLVMTLWVVVAGALGAWRTRTMDA